MGYPLTAAERILCPSFDLKITTWFDSRATILLSAENSLGQESREVLDHKTSPSWLRAVTWLLPKVLLIGSANLLNMAIAVTPAIDVADTTLPSG